MKILIVFHSQTGNTEKIAESIQEGLTGEDVTLLSARIADPFSLRSFDLIILGSGVYDGTVGESINYLLKNGTEFPLKFALFSTHESLDESHHKNAFNQIKQIILKNNCEIIGEFDCLGENRSISSQDKLNMLLTLSFNERKEAEERFKMLAGHPNIDDQEKAKSFAKSLLKSLYST